MSATNSDETCERALPFVGREREKSQLLRLHAQREHVLISGPEGVGKSTLLHQIVSHVPLVICPQSVRLSNICDALEAQLGLDSEGRQLIQRKNRILRAVTVAGKTVVFDGVGWTTPRLSSLLECVSERVPIWIVTRSKHPWDIGRVWPLLCRFSHVELHPFRPVDTRGLIEQLVCAGQLPAATLEAAAHLHRLSAGIPRVLCELLERLATSDYNLQSRFGLKLLDLDRRIQRLPRHD